MVLEPLAPALFDEGVAAAAKEKAPGVPEYGQGWTDDMFMAASVLAPSRRAARAEGAAAWGGGNGCAAFGLVETLARLPKTHPSRQPLLDSYRRLMTAVRAQ